MSLIDNKINNPINVISQLQPRPTPAYMTGEQFRKKFDEAPELLRQKHNELIDSVVTEFQRVDNEKATKVALQNVVLGLIPDGTIDKAKLTVDLANQIDEIDNIVDRKLINTNKEVANLKLYQTASQRIKGVDMTLFGTDFTNDLELKRDLRSGNLKSSANSGTNTIVVSQTDYRGCDKKEITIEQSTKIEQKIITSISTSDSGVLSLGNVYDVASLTGTAFIRIKKLTDNYYFVLWGTSSYIYAKIVQVNDNGDIISIGDTITVVSAGISNDYAMDISILSPTSVVVAYSGTYNYIVACSISGLSITVGTPVTVNASSSYTYNCTCVAVDANTVLACASSTTVSTVKAFTVSGTNITPGASALTLTGAIFISDMLKIDSGKILMISADYSSYYLKARILTVSGTTVGEGGVITIESSAVTNSRKGIAVLDTSNILISYGMGTTTKVTLLTVSGTTVTLSTKYTASSSSNGGASSLVGYSATKALLSWTSSTSAPYLALITLSGTTISKGTDVLISTGASSGVDIVHNTDGKYGVLYYLNGLKFKGMKELKDSTLVLDNNLINSFTTSAIVYRSDDNLIAPSAIKDMRFDIDVLEAQNALSAIIQCTKDPNITYTAYASIVDSSASESYIPLTILETNDLIDGTKELVFSGEVVTAGNKIALKIIINNQSGQTATIYKVLGGVE